jgi:hypothetical protein
MKNAISLILLRRRPTNIRHDIVSRLAINMSDVPVECRRRIAQKGEGHQAMYSEALAPRIRTQGQCDM